MTQASVLEVECSQPGCTYQVPGGRCANGFEDPTGGRCPNLVAGLAATPEGPTPSNLADDAQEASVLPEVLDVDIHTALELNVNSARTVTASGETRVVVVAGLARSGKTTLLTSLYERFHSGPVEGYAYAGSKTFVAFEQWCHESRLRSGREAADTARTPHVPQDEARFLHIRLARESGDADEHMDLPADPRQNLLITDLHGEAFRRVRDNAADATRMPFLHRAEHLVQLVDGAKLIHAAERHGAVQDAIGVLQSCIAAGVIGPRTIVHLVGTKWDLIRPHKNRAAIEAYWAQRTSDIQVMLRDRVGRVDVRTTAARAAPDASSEDWGIGVLLRSWMEESLLSPPQPQLPPSNPPMSEFDRLEVRHKDA